MKTKILLILILLFSTSCLYTDIKFPLDEDLWETKLGDKVGKSSNHTVLWLVSWGDAGTKKAAEDGGMTQINHLDRGIQSYFFGTYTRSYTIAYGQ